MILKFRIENRSDLEKAFELTPQFLGLLPEDIRKVVELQDGNFFDSIRKLKIEFCELQDAEDKIDKYERDHREYREQINDLENRLNDAEATIDLISNILANRKGTKDESESTQQTESTHGIGEGETD